MVLTETEYM